MLAASPQHFRNNPTFLRNHPLHTPLDPLSPFTDNIITFQFCNLFETASASEWLMYISEWDAPGGGLPLSNIRVTTKVAVNALLGDSPDLVNYGSALMANLGDKEVKAVVCILQFSIKSLLLSIAAIFFLD